MCTLLLFYMCQYIQLVNKAIESNHTPTEFPPAESVHSDREVLKSPTIIVDSSFSPCNFISFPFTYFDALLLGAYTCVLLEN